MKSSTLDKIVVGVYFSFEELNSLAFLNAVFYLAKSRNERLYFIAYVPPGFKCLAFEANEVVEYPQEIVSNLYQNYFEVNEYIISSKIEKFRELMRNAGFSLAKCLKLRGYALEILLRIFAYPRARKFFFRSGIFRWAKKDFRSRYPTQRHIDLIVHDYVEFDFKDYTPKFTTPNLGKSFERRFRLLGEAISRGMSMKIGVERLTTPSVRSRYRDLAPCLLVRTRNYMKKATVHNSSKSIVRRLVVTAVAKGFRVVNVGAPALDLGIEENELYQQFDNISLDEEVSIRADAIVTQGDAGLFTLFAAAECPLCTTSREWSMIALPDIEISLMKSRWDSGRLDDLDFSVISDEFESWLTRLLENRESPC